MSIREAIADQLRKGGLVQWMPENGAEHRRYLFLSAELANLMRPGGWTEPEVEARMGQLGADFDRFVSDTDLPVGLSPNDKEAHAFLARIDPVEARVWDIRSRAPRPGVRVMGFFAERDVFLAAHAHFRRELGGRSDPRWTWARDGAVAWWQALFAPELALLSEDLEDYGSDFIQA